MAKESSVGSRWPTCIDASLCICLTCSPASGVLLQVITLVIVASKRSLAASTTDEPSSCNGCIHRHDGVASHDRQTVYKVALTTVDRSLTVGPLGPTTTATVSTGSTLMPKNLTPST